MKLGDFTALAKQYKNRTGYSSTALNVLLSYVRGGKSDFMVADVGAGTGKLTENLAAIGLTGFAVEPNDAMRAEGENAFRGIDAFSWSKGTAEETGLPDSCVDWVLMGSSFHWTDAPAALKEFHRILKPNGFFTAIWNPRDIISSEFHMDIENEIYAMVPTLKRVSSGSSSNMTGMDEKLLSTEYFNELFFLEAKHNEIMTRERYLGAWKSVNDIQAQAGEDGFKKIIAMIEEKTAGMETVTVPYKSRAWTVKAIK